MIYNIINGEFMDIKEDYKDYREVGYDFVIERLQNQKDELTNKIHLFNCLGIADELNSLFRNNEIINIKSFSIERRCDYESEISYIILAFTDIDEKKIKEDSFFKKEYIKIKKVFDNFYFDDFLVADGFKEYKNYDIEINSNISQKILELFLNKELTQFLLHTKLEYNIPEGNLRSKQKI